MAKYSVTIERKMLVGAVWEIHVPDGHKLDLDNASPDAIFASDDSEFIENVYQDDCWDDRPRIVEWEKIED